MQRAIMQQLHQANPPGATLVRQRRSLAGRRLCAFKGIHGSHSHASKLPAVRAAIQQPFPSRVTGHRSAISAPPLPQQQHGRHHQRSARPRPVPRDVSQQADLVFDYCDVNGYGPVESTLRSYRALCLQLMRRVVPTENRSDAVRGVICATYMIEICLWVVITAALPAMVGDARMPWFTEAQTGMVLAAGTFGSVIGKIVASAIMDSIHPLFAMISVMLLVAALNALFAAGNSMAWFTVLWCLGRVVHASGWVAATRLICSWTPEELRGAALGSLAFSARIGFMAGGALLGLMLLKGCPWQWLFYAISVAAVAQSALLFALVPVDAPYSLSARTEDYDDEESAKLNPPEQSGFAAGTGELADDATEKLAEEAAEQLSDEELQQITPDDSTEADDRSAAIKDFVSSPQVWMAVIARCLLHVVYEFQAFLNLFAQQSLGLSSGMAAQVAAGFSAGSAFAVLGGGFLFCRLQGTGKRNLTFLLCALTAGSFVGLLTPGIPAAATIALVVLLGAAVSVPYYVPLVNFNIRRGGRFSAVLEGATETGAFACAMLFDLAVGKLLAPGGPGWPGVLKVLLATASAAVVITTIFMEQERRLENEAIIAAAAEAATP